MQAALGQGIGQGTHHMLLPHQLIKGAGPPFAGKDLMAHQANKASLVMRGLNGSGLK
jgi:hypothetical protein